MCDMPTLRICLPMLAAVTLSGCSGAAAGGDPGGPEYDGRLQVTASFYPVQFLAERIGGEHAEVHGLTPPGQEPHSLSLTGEDLAQLRDSDLLFYIGNGLQSDVERALISLPEELATRDLLTVEGLDLLPAEPDAHDDHSDADHGHNDEHAGGIEAQTAGEAVDPHIWLDPIRFTVLAGAVEDAMATADPAHAAQYAANREALEMDLAHLHEDIDRQLGGCGSNTLVVAHSAFGYFADRYALEQVGIAGLSPDDEPDAKTLVEIMDTARQEGVATVFFEEALPPKLAESVADSIGAEVSALTTAEFAPHAGEPEYLELMRANGQAVADGLGCR